MLSLGLWDFVGFCRLIAVFKVELLCQTPCGPRTMYSNYWHPNCIYIRISRLASKRQEVRHPEELSKSGRHCTAEALGRKRFEDGISLPATSPHNGGINTIHNNSECSSVSRKNLEELRWLALVSQHTKDNDKPLMKRWSHKPARDTLDAQYFHPRQYSMQSKVLHVSMLRSLKKTKVLPLKSNLLNEAHFHFALNLDSTETHFYKVWETPFILVSLPSAWIPLILCSAPDVFILAHPEGQPVHVPHTFIKLTEGVTVSWMDIHSESS